MSLTPAEVRETLSVCSQGMIDSLISLDESNDVHDDLLPVHMAYGQVARGAIDRMKANILDGDYTKVGDDLCTESIMVNILTVGTFAIQRLILQRHLSEAGEYTFANMTEVESETYFDQLYKLISIVAPSDHQATLLHLVDEHGICNSSTSDDLDFALLASKRLVMELEERIRERDAKDDA